MLNCDKSNEISNSENMTCLVCLEELNEENSNSTMLNLCSCSYSTCLDCFQTQFRFACKEPFCRPISCPAQHEENNGGSKVNKKVR